MFGADLIHHEVLGKPLCFDIRGAFVKGQTEQPIKGCLAEQIHFFTEAREARW